MEGIPLLTARPFVERLASEPSSPLTFSFLFTLLQSERHAYLGGEAQVVGSESTIAALPLQLGRWI